jgi:hypothetical protein
MPWKGIAQDSLRDTPKNPFEIWEEESAEKPYTAKAKMPNWREMRPWAATLPKPRTDIQVAPEVTGRRAPRQIKVERDTTVRDSKVGYRLDLRSTCLQGADLTDIPQVECHPPRIDAILSTGQAFWPRRANV